MDTTLNADVAAYLRRLTDRLNGPAGGFTLEQLTGNPSMSREAVGCAA